MFVHATGKVASASEAERCGNGQILISNAVVAAAKPGCTVLDAKRLRTTGAIAIDIEKGGVKITTAREKQGQRLWSQYERISPTKRP